jgi:hypothetical protein
MGAATMTALPGGAGILPVKRRRKTILVSHPR